MSSKAQEEVNRIMKALSDAIVDNRLPPGARLPEARLVKALKANRNHVRMALQKLSSEVKVVSIIPNKGAIVSRPTIKEAKDVFHARIVVEKAIAELSVDNLTAVNQNHLLKHLEREKHAIEQHDRQAMIRESGNFHKLLAEIGNNKVLAELLDGLISRSSLIIALYQETPSAKCSCEDHEAITDALIKKDTKEVIRLMDLHLKAIESSLLLTDKGVDVDIESVFG